jgi:hypothetical protein
VVWGNASSGPAPVTAVDLGPTILLDEALRTARATEGEEMRYLNRPLLAGLVLAASALFLYLWLGASA